MEDSDWNSAGRRREEDDREKLMEIVDVVSDVKAAGYALRANNDSLLPELVIFASFIVVLGVCVQVYDCLF